MPTKIEPVIAPLLYPERVPVALPDGCIFSMRTDDAKVVIDEGPYKAHGTPGGAVLPVVASGPCGRVLYFILQSKVTIGTKVPATTDFSVEMWWQPTSAVTKVAQVLIGRWTGTAGGYMWRLRTSNAHVSFQVSPDGSAAGRTLTTSTTVTAGQWHHIVATFKDGGAGASQMRVYINSAVNKVTVNDASPYYKGTTDLILGLYSGGTTGGTMGYVGLVRIYNYCLSATDVKRLYNEYGSRFLKGLV